MLLCIDCKYYKAGVNIEWDQCTHEAALKESDYNGVREEIPVSHFTCASMRAHVWGCPNGKLFEAKP